MYIGLAQSTEADFLSNFAATGLEFTLLFTSVIRVKRDSSFRHSLSMCFQK